MGVEKVQTGGGAPMAQEAGFDVLLLERLFQQGVVIQIDLADGQVIRGAPPGVEQAQFIGRERFFHGVANNGATACAIMSSSFVRMTRTRVGASSREIKGAEASLRWASRRMPKNPRPSQIRARISGAFSPMPPANASRSKPPRAAA